MGICFCAGTRGSCRGDGERALGSGHEAVSLQSWKELFLWPGGTLAEDEATSAFFAPQSVMLDLTCSTL